MSVTEPETRATPPAVEEPRRRMGLAVSAVVVLAVGLLQIAYAVLDGWCAIVYPGQFRILTLGWFLLAMAFPLILAGHVLYCILTLLRRRSVWSLLYLTLPILLLVGVYLLIGARDMWPIMLRVDSHALGARTRIKWAGGAARVRQEALALLAGAPDGDVRTWPESLRRLRGSALSLETNQFTRQVTVSLPNRFALDDSFCYVILADPVGDAFVGKTGRYRPSRYWRIAEGIYLCEE